MEHDGELGRRGGAGRRRRGDVRRQLVPTTRAATTTSPACPSTAWTWSAASPRWVRSLSVGTVSFGSTEASVFSDTDLGAAAATLTIDGFSGATDGRVGAFGANALTNVLSATDPGEIYQVDEGGELVLSPTPHGNPGPVNAGFYYQNSHGTGELPTGTFAFLNPGGTVSSLLSNVGDRGLDRTAGQRRRR